jgi:hypothetical protein
VFQARPKRELRVSVNGDDRAVGLVTLRFWNLHRVPDADLYKAIRRRKTRIRNKGLRGLSRFNYKINKLRALEQDQDYKINNPLGYEELRRVAEGYNSECRQYSKTGEIRV